MRPGNKVTISAASIVLVLLLAGSAMATGGVRDAHPLSTDPPGYHEPDGSVTASELWAFHKEAQACLEASGAATIGPYPQEGGLSIFLAHTEIEYGVEGECLGGLIGAVGRFTTDNSPEGYDPGGATGWERRGDWATGGERAALLVIGEELASCLEASGVVEAGATEAEGMEAVFALSQADQTGFKACVDKTG